MQTESRSTPALRDYNQGLYHLHNDRIGSAADLSRTFGDASPEAEVDCKSQLLARELTGAVMTTAAALLLRSWAYKSRLGEAFTSITAFNLAFAVATFNPPICKPRGFLIGRLESSAPWTPCQYCRRQRASQLGYCASHENSAPHSFI